MSEIMEEALINKLPDECLAHIFSFLPVEKRLEAEKVCKRWYIISKRGWNDTKKLKILSWQSNDMNYAILKRCGRFLRKLKIRFGSQNLNCLSMVTECCQLDQLEAIEIEFDYDVKLEFEPPKLREIFERAGKLVAIELINFNSEYMMGYLNFLNPMTLEKLKLWPINVHSSMDERELSINPDRFPNLKELDLANSEIIEDEMKRENESLKKLEKLGIGICNFPETFLKRIKTFTNLREFTFTDNDCNISNEDIAEIAHECTNLETIELSFPVDTSTSLTSKCFQYLGSILALENLTVYHMWVIDDRKDIEYLTNVKFLYFDHCNYIIGDELINLIENSLNLERLAFDRVSDIDESFMNDVGKIFHSGQRQKPLYVIVEDCDFEEDRVPKGEAADHPLLTWDIR